VPDRRETVKIRIEVYGNLEIERGGQWKWMKCPHQGEGHYCSDNCPLFGEPEQVEWASDQILCLCDHKILEGTIEDLRRKG
jgi:hypothetical protein